MARNWYRDKKYKQLMPETELGDGSLVSVSETKDYGPPDEVVHCIERKWPSGNVERHYCIPPKTPFGETRWIASGSSYQPSSNPPVPEEEKNVNIMLRPAVPGNKMGDNFDVATGLYVKNRDQIERIFRDRQIARASRTDLKNANLSGGGGEFSPYSKFEQFEVNDAGSVPDAPSGNLIPVT